MATLDESLAAAVRTGWRDADVTPRERAMLAYVEKVTLRPWTVTPADLDELRGAGFDDRGILQIAGIAAAFAWLNRVADGVGVGKGDGGGPA